MYLIKYAPIFLEPATVSCSCERFHKFSEKSSSNGLFFNRRERWMGVLPKYLPLNSSFQFTTPLGSYNHAILSQCVLSLSLSLSQSLNLFTVDPTFEPYLRPFITQYTNCILFFTRHTSTIFL